MSARKSALVTEVLMVFLSPSRQIMGGHCKNGLHPIPSSFLVVLIFDTIMTNEIERAPLIPTETFVIVIQAISVLGTSRPTKIMIICM
jgi:hypothetical protein